MLNLIQTILLMILVIIEILRLFNINVSINKKSDNNKTKRTHHYVKMSNYENSFGGRGNYDIYKNEKGLYEPVTPSRGINLNSKEIEV